VCSWRLCCSAQSLLDTTTALQSMTVVAVSIAARTQSVLTNLLTYLLQICNVCFYSLVIWRRNRFQVTGSKVPEPVPKPGTRNRFLNIMSLTHCIICVLYESLFVNNESRNILLKLMPLSFHLFSFIHSFIRCIYQQPNVLARHWQ